MSILKIVEKIKEYKENKKIKTIFVESDQFKQMLSYNQYVEKKSEKKQVKYKLLEEIQNKMGSKWYRLKEETRQAIDMICFLSTELGFFYASAEYLAEKHSISARTMRYVFKELEQLGQVIATYRRNSKCNGRGKPVYLFVNHPYFKYWINLLNLENCITDCNTENAGTSCESKEEGQEKVATYSLPKKQERTINTATKEITIDFIPNDVKNDENFQTVAKYYALALYDKIKNGLNVDYISSLVNKDLKHKIRQALYSERDKEIKLHKQREEESRQALIELGVIKKPKLPFYNWLES